MSTIFQVSPIGTPQYETDLGTPLTAIYQSVEFPWQEPMVAGGYAGNGEMPGPQGLYAYTPDDSPLVCVIGCNTPLVPGVQHSEVPEPGTVALITLGLLITVTGHFFTTKYLTRRTSGCKIILRK